MKKNSVLILTSILTFAAGCKPSADKTSSALDRQTAAENSGAKVWVAGGTNDATQGKKDYAYARKAEFVTEMQTQLAGINRELDILSAKMDAASDATKAEAKPRFQALRDQSDQLHKRLEEAKSASESTWNNVKAGSSKAYEGLKDGFAQARQWASDKLAP
jgi:lysophospholipase L1-like esterase